MAVYKVPQDVEADDKLIGPFSFRQFVYLIVVALSGALAWGLSQLFLPLFIIPLPVIVFFGALALPLRKDQPMEIFMAAMASYYIKPHKRMWDPDGIESLIEITVPKIVDIQLTKDISQSDAQQRFSYLSELVDSKGWSVRGVGIQATSSVMSNDAYLEAQQAVDILDDNAHTSQALDQKINQSDALRRQQAIDAMHTPMPPTPDYFNGGQVAEPQTAPEPTNNILPETNPYLDNIQQKVIQPILQPVSTLQPAIITLPETTPTTSEKVLSTDIINKLANDDTLSIATIASEANRINTKQDMNQEVFIPLR